ncbi:MAG: AAA family ATPase [Longimicrobiaceae bacterium]
MIQSLRFVNYRVLRDAVLPLGPFTLLVGPNGSGKSTVLHALRAVRSRMSGAAPTLKQIRSLAAGSETASLSISWAPPFEDVVTEAVWTDTDVSLRPLNVPLRDFLRRLATFSLNENAIVRPVPLGPGIRLAEDGGNLAGVLDQMRDENPEYFEKLNAELGSLIPEFDRILFETPQQGQRAFLLRTRDGHHPIRAADLSQGTVLALAILTLAYSGEPPSMVCIEEPDRGIHPRLYREIRDALYRLSYPEKFGLDRPPVQVLITSHSPYMLDLHKDHPEEVVIAEKVGSEGTFSRLSDREDLDELLSEASLGEIWYSGVLGGVPAGT